MFSPVKIIILIFSTLVTCSCCKRNIASVQKNIAADSSVKNAKLTEATVIDYSKVDGCRFLIELENKEKLQPENLSAEFEKDKMKVLVKYHVTNKMTVCMAGKTIYLDFIKAKKE